ncbi:MAG: bifunctional UDP-N-acetylglucosamine diphosphorylase/glucosamine-1-phosphate N-acetyltransferase GlmU [bacterium]
MSVEAIILAAGRGVRMRSDLPKSLHVIGGAPMLAHVITAARATAPDKIHVVIGRDGDAVRAAMANAMADAAADECAINWVTQDQPRGTAHAVMQAMPAVDPAATALVLYSDTPLISAATMRSLLAAASEGEGAIGLLTAEVDDPIGLGRIVRDRDRRIVRIVEEKDADEAQRKIRECNAGALAAPAAVLNAALAKINDDNAQREFYLTDAIAHAAADGTAIVARAPTAHEETIGVNSHADLARAERVFQAACARVLLEQGVCLRDPARFDLRGRCAFGRGCVVDVNVVLEGEVAIGDDCRIGANTIIRDSRIGDGSVIDSNCVIDGATVGARCRIGPFARLRPQAEIGDQARVGNFVEIKKSFIGRGSKANHLSYIGDSEVGAGVNVGAGVITCNYDGANKHRSVIGDDVLVGSNSQLVAPVTIGDGATIGAGSTITADVAAGTLAVGRARQRSIAGWTRPVKRAK